MKQDAIIAERKSKLGNEFVPMRTVFLFDQDEVDVGRATRVVRNRMKKLYPDAEFNISNAGTYNVYALELEQPPEFPPVVFRHIETGEVNR